MQTNLKTNILIVGSCGNLGRHITKEALKQNDLLVNILVHNMSHSQEIADLVKKAGGKVFEGDVTKPETIKDITKGMHTVISALIGDNDVIIKGQSNLLEDAERNGVKRFVPSDFSLEIWNIPRGRHFFMEQRLQFKELLDKSKVKGLHFTNGMFMETYFWMANQYGFSYWGDINQKFDLTSEEDVGKFVIAAVRDKNRVGHVKVSGAEVSTKEVVDTYNLVLNKKESAKYMGSIEELKTKVKELRDQGKIFDSIQMGYCIPLYDGSGKIKDKMNSQFPSVKVTSLEDFIKSTQGKPSYQYTIPGIVKGCEKQILTSS